MSAAIRHCGALSRQMRLIEKQWSASNNYCKTLHLVPTNYQNYQSYRGHKDFSHKPEKEHNFTKFWHYLLGVGMICVFIDWPK